MDFGTLEILPADMIGRVEDRIKAAAGLADDCVFLSLASDEEHIKMPPSDRFVTIFPARFPPWQGVVTGAGGFGEDALLGFDASIRTTVFCRLLNDQEARASQTIRDKSFGILKTVTDLVACLQGWPDEILDDEGEGTGRSYLREPMRIVGSGPEFVTKKIQATVWVLCWIVWEMRFSAKLV